MASLQCAVATLDKEEQVEAYMDGLEILHHHSTNYGDSGPQKLALLWWEWDCLHWDVLQKGVSMNFMEEPLAELVKNQDMVKEKTTVAVEFVEELIQLQILKKASEHGVTLKNNFLMFLVPKPNQPGEYRVIADGKAGHQNDACVADPCCMISPSHILPHLYTGGYSASTDMSKYFHMFRTAVKERMYLGLIHPVTGEHYFYDRLPMGTRNSPAASGRFGASFTRELLDYEVLFGGVVLDNSMAYQLAGGQCTPEWGEGRVLMGPDNLPSVLPFLHVDDFLLHGPTYAKTGKALTHLMDEAIKKGLVCQAKKTIAPCQSILFCGLVYDTTDIPTLCIPKRRCQKH